MNHQLNIETDTGGDNEIISRVLKGEKNLFAILVRRYNQRLYRTAMSIINDDAEAEDIMQVAYIKAYENLGRFALKSAFSTWLTRILINESLLRIRQRQRTVHFNNETADMENNQQPAPPSETPVMKVLNTELKMMLEKAISRLPEKYRVVFVLREIENMNITETKECLSISEANVKVRLNRAKALLKDSLSSYLNYEDILHFHLSRCDKMVESVMEKIEKL